MLHWFLQSLLIVATLEANHKFWDWFYAFEVATGHSWFKYAIKINNAVTQSSPGTRRKAPRMQFLTLALKLKYSWKKRESYRWLIGHFQGSIVSQNRLLMCRSSAANCHTLHARLCWTRHRGKFPNGSYSPIELNDATTPWKYSVVSICDAQYDSHIKCMFMLIMRWYKCESTAGRNQWKELILQDELICERYVMNVVCW